AQARPQGQFAPTHRIVAGERRWRAIGILIKRGDLDHDHQLLCRVVDLDDAGHRRVALVENLQRRDLKPLEEARAIRELMRVTDVGTAEVAAEIGFTQRWVQQRLQLLELPIELQGRMERGELTVERGREAAAIWPKLPPIKQVELREGKIAVETAKKWLAEQPEAVELDDEQLLILAEVAWAIAAKPANHWSSATCDYRTEGLPRQMEKAGLLFFRRHSYGPDEDKTYVRLTEASFRQLRRLCGADDYLNRTALEPLLRRARVKVIGGSPLSGHYRPDAHKDVDRLFKDKRYHTAWLNKPFEVHPDRKVELAKRKAEEAKRNKEWAEKEKAQKEALAKRREEGARILDAAMVLGVVAAAAPPQQLAEGAAELIAQTGRPLPWRVEKDGGIVDAVGGMVLQGWYYDAGGAAHAQRHLICILVNRAAGVAFAPPGAPPPQLTRESYLARLEAALIEACEELERPPLANPMAKGEATFDAFLAKHELTFPSADEDWDAILDDLIDEAIAIADEEAAEAEAGVDDDQVDLEDVIAEADAAPATPLTDSLARIVADA
ncbi:MAG TPA: hypothetical protein VFH92_11315, partial [Phenylobacterium sp.]|nr:hypothetical protein [Phenylobacterium sp.]